MKNIVILNGSPRIKGNTEALVNAFMDGAKEKGHKVTHLPIATNYIKGCIACDYCMKNEGTCIQKDGIQAIYEALYTADMVVFASPVYYFGVSAQLKAVIDRFYASIAKPFPITATALLVALGGDPKEDASPTIATYQRLYEYSNWENKGIVVAGGVMNRGDIQNHNALKEAYILGKSI